MLLSKHSTLPRIFAPCSAVNVRSAATLANNKHIYIFPRAGTNILTLLSDDPPDSSLAIGTSTTNPPNPDTFTENPRFVRILQETLRVHAHRDPGVLGQAAAFVSTSGSSLGSGGALFPHQARRRNRKGGDGAGGASSQGGAGGGGKGGYVHLSDSRLPPDYGRIAWPEDIFGSLRVGSDGNLEGEDGGYMESGTYRILTREGILGLSDFLREKVVERLKEERNTSKLQR